MALKFIEELFSIRGNCVEEHRCQYFPGQYFPGQYFLQFSKNVALSVTL